MGRKDQEPRIRSKITRWLAGRSSVDVRPIRAIRIYDIYIIGEYIYMFEVEIAYRIASRARERDAMSESQECRDDPYFTYLRSVPARSFASDT